MNERVKDYTPLGTHSILVDGDCVYIVIRGTLTVPDLSELMALMTRVKRENGQLFVFYDARQATGIEPAARKNVIAQNSVDMQPAFQVIFGISFSLRALLSMIMRAQKLLRNFDVPLRIAESEEEARALFAQECARLRKTN